MQEAIVVIKDLKRYGLAFLKVDNKLQYLLFKVLFFLNSSFELVAFNICLISTNFFYLLFMFICNVF